MDFLSVISNLRKKVKMELTRGEYEEVKFSFSLLDRYVYRVSMRKREVSEGNTVLMYIGLNKSWLLQYEALRARIFRKIEETLEEHSYKCSREAHTVYVYMGGEPWVRIMLDSHLYHFGEEMKRPQVFVETPSCHALSGELLKHMVLRVLDTSEIVYKSLACKLKHREVVAPDVCPSNVVYDMFGMEEVLAELADRYQGWLEESVEGVEEEEEGWSGEEPYEEMDLALNLIDDLHSELEYAFLIHEPWLVLDQLAYMLYMAKCIISAYRDKEEVVSLLERKMGYFSLMKRFVKKLGRAIKHLVDEVGYSGNIPRFRFDDRMLLVGRGTYIPWERYKRDVKLTVRAVLRESRLLGEEIHMLRVVANS